MLNLIVLQGRLTREPELKTTQSGMTVCSFGLAVERDRASKSGERETDFFDCSAWQKTGEFVSKYFGKGSQILISGRLQSRKYTDKEGQNRTAYEIMVDTANFAGSKAENPKAAQNAQNAQNAVGFVPPPEKPEDVQAGFKQREFSDLSPDDELPF